MKKIKEKKNFIEKKLESTQILSKNSNNWNENDVNIISMELEKYKVNKLLNIQFNILLFYRK